MIINRRDAFFGTVAALLVHTVTSNAQQASSTTPRPPVFQHNLPNVSLEGWEVRVSHVDYAPGRVGQPHQHSGFLFAYVVEGAVIAKIIGDGMSDEERTYHVGEM